ncbi:MAG: hypothetical protein LWX51_15745 [Deltaproteobacteria bacterium]|nr:hypothetical protein [Deltaproteobacteria bacterium]
MTRNTLLARGTSVLIVLAIIMGTTSCGTILYPERRGQPAGKIDVGVAVLDGIGLLVFFVPGIIAFAVDFATGAIYLPSSSSRLELNPSNLQDAKIIHAKSKALTRSEIEMLVKEEIRQEINLTSPQTRVAKVLPDRDLAWGDIAETLTPNQLAAFENN